MKKNKKKIKKIKKSNLFDLLMLPGYYKSDIPFILPERFVGNI